MKAYLEMEDDIPAEDREAEKRAALRNDANMDHFLRNLVCSPLAYSLWKDDYDRLGIRPVMKPNQD